MKSTPWRRGNAASISPSAWNGWPRWCARPRAGGSSSASAFPPPSRRWPRWGNSSPAPMASASSWMSTTAKKVHLRVHTPLRKNPYPEAGYTGQRLIRELGQLVQAHRTTLVFTNTRSGAEASTYWLREALPGARRADRVPPCLAGPRPAPGSGGPAQARRIARRGLLDQPGARASISAPSISWSCSPRPRA